MNLNARLGRLERAAHGRLDRLATAAADAATLPRLLYEMNATIGGTPELDDAQIQAVYGDLPDPATALERMNAIVTGDVGT